jgi:DNA-binding response OmpR family regulator
MSLLSECRVGEGRRALVVDDEPVVGQIIGSVLQQMGYAVDQAQDGDQALELAGGQDYDLVICDLLMPRLNGMMLYDLWLRDAPQLARRTVFVTGDSLGNETSDFINRTGCRCIFKPFRLHELAEVVVQVSEQACV